MDRIKSHLVPVSIVGALGAIVFLAVFAWMRDLPKSPLNLIAGLAHSALSAQLFALPVLAIFRKYRNAAVFGVVVLMASCLWGPLESAFGMATGLWLPDQVQYFVQVVVVPIAFATIVLVTGKPQALFAVTPEENTVTSPNRPPNEHQTDTAS